MVCLLRPTSYCLGCVFKIAITSDSKYLIAAYSDDECIRIFDLQAQKLIHRFKDAHKGKAFHRLQSLICHCLASITSLVVTPDNKYIVSGSEDKSIKMFDLDGKKLAHHFQDVHQGILLFVPI